MEKKYQVFISSTYKDLIEARSKVRDAILSMMHFPVGMEMFNAADEEQWEIIQETIDSSDYYVLILGQRYGSVIESGSDAGISYTEKEFRYIEKAEILREKGTNRSQFFRGQVAKYNWVDFGDSYLQSDLNAAYLWAQLEAADEINKNRLASWNRYYKAFKPLADKGILELPTIPAGCVHNAHMFYLKCPCGQRAGCAHPLHGPEGCGGLCQPGGHSGLG